ncbi:hypothetical protein [Acetobacter orientalis]|uniref:hypothetical protein n=1 Tax=Acetobacter orientalis TaxID=146474 RepID=UPI00241F29D1|nr:hypothetical protein [Acetobacter orientalis]
MKKHVKLLLLLAPLALAGCGGGQEAPTARDDAQWDQAMTAGTDSFDLGRYSVAINQYRRAATLAVLRDDGAAIAEAGYNLAVAQLAADQPQAALQTLQAARQAASARGNSQATSFDLVQAAVLYRLKQPQQAIQYAQHAVADPSAEAQGRAALVMGLAADEAGNQAALQQANSILQGLNGKLSRSLQADKAEIAARYILASNPAQAATLAEQAATLRRDDAAYSDMSRALALAGTAASRMGDNNRATALWARAAQSAAVEADNAAQGDATTLAHGALSRGNTHTASEDAQQWGTQAGTGLVLRPFATPKTP